MNQENTNTQNISESDSPLKQVNHPAYKLYGPAIFVDDNGKLQFNQPSLAKRFIMDSKIAYEPGTNRLRQYGDKTGVWKLIDPTALKGELMDFIRAVCIEHGAEEFAQKIKPSVVNSVLTMVKSKGIPGDKPDNSNLFAVGNGILDFSSGTAVKQEFNPERWFTSGSTFQYTPEAKCPKFIEKLMKAALSDEDISLIQRYFGSIFLGPNHAQRILVLTGTAGSGKSTLVTILERIIGTELVAYLRAEQLAGRFETSGFHDKRLLAGKDVPGDTLTHKGAKLIKCLTGNDSLETETKYVANKEKMIGNFHLILTSNSRLKIAFDGDEEAWKRRLLVVEFDHKPNGQPIPNFAETLLKEEGAGILGWLAEGAVNYAKEMAAKGNYELTERQQGKIDAIIAESRTVKEFVMARLKADQHAQITVDDLTKRYLDYCAEKGWIALTDRQFQNELPKILKEVHGVVKRNDIISGDKSVRGFKGVGFFKN